MANFSSEVLHNSADNAQVTLNMLFI